MVALSTTLAMLKPTKVLVAGDFMIDRYTVGKVGRISPEAPVAVVNVEEETQRPGGAGNVILNLRSLGAQVCAVGAVGDDDAGRALKEILQGEGCDISGVATDSSRPTPLKNRVLAGSQQLVRIDYEQVAPVSSKVEAWLVQQCEMLVPTVDAVAISDYGKGTLCPQLLGAVIDAARRHKIPVIADPKGCDFSRYRGATVVKPNAAEAYAAAGLDATASLDDVAATLMSQVPMDHLMITRSADGIAVYSKDGSRADYPVRVREVQDVTGAGDTVLATLTIAMASGIPLERAVPLANLAAGIAIERVGCARVTTAELGERLLAYELDDNVVSSAGLPALGHALQGSACTVAAVEGDEMSLSLLQQLSQLGDEMTPLIVSVPADAHPELVHALATHRHVSWVVKGVSEEQLGEHLPIVNSLC